MFREDPWRKYEEKGVGARTAMMERRARELAAAEMRAEEEAAGAALAQEQLHGRGLTEAKASFLGAVPARGDDPSRGKRIMYTQDGAPVSPRLGARAIERRSCRRRPHCEAAHSAPPFFLPNVRAAQAHRDARFLVESGLLAPHLAVDVAPVDPATLPAEAITYADRMLVTGQTRAPNAASYSRVRNDFFSKPIELSKKPGIWADADDDHVYPSIAAARGS